MPDSETRAEVSGGESENFQQLWIAATRAHQLLAHASWDNQRGSILEARDTLATALANVEYSDVV